MLSTTGGLEGQCSSALWPLSILIGQWKIIPIVHSQGASRARLGRFCFILKTPKTHWQSAVHKILFVMERHSQVMIPAPSSLSDRHLFSPTGFPMGSAVPLMSTLRPPDQHRTTRLLNCPFPNPNFTTVIIIQSPLSFLKEEYYWSLCICLCLLLSLCK